MSWQEHYNSRLISVEEAVKKIPNGGRVFFGHAVGEPTTFQETMAKHKDNFKDVEVCHLVYLGKGEYMAPDMEGHFRHNALFVGAGARPAVKEGRADVTPTFFSEVPRLFRDDYLPTDVFAFQCTPPDKHGYVNLGVSCDYALAAIEKSACCIGEVNENMPTTYGETFVHVSEIDYFFTSNKPMIELQPPKISEVEMKIGKFCADLVEDGATLQLGIGSMPDAILSFLGDKKDLGIHTEMIADGVLDLIEKGVINGKCKKTYPGKIVSTFLMGTKRLYDFVDKNPMIQMMPVDYTNNPYNIAMNDKVTAINACIQVDLMGQICSEAVGLRQISGIGGQVDFIRGATLSKGGKAIIAIQSTTPDGKISKIVPFLDNGACVTTSRCDADYVVTEYGVAKLKGATLRDRAKRLIAIAHPDYRPGLIAEFNARFREQL